MSTAGNVVYILRSNPVDPDARVEKEACTLKKHGYDVRVLAWDRESDHGPVSDWLTVGDQRIPITRLGFRATYGEGFQNLLPYLKFQLAMRRFLLRADPAIVHACDFDTACFSYGAARRRHAKFVFDLFDFLQADPQNLLERVVHRVVYGLINRADATIICTEERKKQIEGSRPKRLTVIHNTPMEAQRTETRFPLQSNSDRLKAAYVGVFQEHRMLDALVSFFSAHPEYEWHVAGFGKLQPMIERAAETSDHIFFYGRIPYSSALSLEQQADVILALYDPQIDNHRYAAPNKFYESLALGKPVMMVRGSGMSDVVERWDIGAVIDCSEEGVARGLETLAARRAEWPEMAEKMKTLYDRCYSWEEMERRLIELYEAL